MIEGSYSRSEPAEEVLAGVGGGCSGEASADTGSAVEDAVAADFEVSCSELAACVLSDGAAAVEAGIAGPEHATATTATVISAPSFPEKMYTGNFVITAL